MNAEVRETQKVCWREEENITSSVRNEHRGKNNTKGKPLDKSKGYNFLLPSVLSGDNHTLGQVVIITVDVRSRTQIFVMNIVQLLAFILLLAIIFSLVLIFCWLLFC